MLQIAEKDLLKQVRWDMSRKTGDLVYQKLSDFWGEYEEAVVERGPNTLNFVHRVKEASGEQKEVLKIVFNCKNGVCTLDNQKSTKGKKYGEMMNAFSRKIFALNVKPYYLAYIGYQ